jgi:hypothetical protein
MLRRGGSKVTASMAENTVGALTDKRDTLYTTALFVRPGHMDTGVTICARGDRSTALPRDLNPVR